MQDDKPWGSPPEPGSGDPASLPIRDTSGRTENGEDAANAHAFVDEAMAIEGVEAQAKVQNSVDRELERVGRYSPNPEAKWPTMISSANLGGFRTVKDGVEIKLVIDRTDPEAMSVLSTFLGKAITIAVFHPTDRPAVLSDKQLDEVW